MVSVILGRDKESGKNVFLGQQERRLGLYVIGKTGTGKSTFLVNLAVQDIAQGLGVCFIDPHGDAISDIIARIPEERVKDVILFNPHDSENVIGLNLFTCSNPKDLLIAARTTDQVMHTFEKLWGPDSRNPSWGPLLQDLLRNSTLTFLEDQGYTLAELPMLLTNAAFRAALTANLTNQQVKDFWELEYNPLKPEDQREYRSSTLNKVREFLTQPLIRHIVAQAESRLDFREAMDSGKILLVRIPVTEGEDVATLLGTMIIGKILTAALSRVDIPEQRRRPFHLYADEYQRFATSDFATLLAEARKFAVATTIAHQHRNQFKPHDPNRGASLNAGNLVVFQVIGEDAEELAKQFKAPLAKREIIGQEPVMVPKQDVIDDLLTHGHPNPMVMRFVETYLRKLATQAQQEYGGEYIRAYLAELKSFIASVIAEKNPTKPFPYALFKDRYGSPPIATSILGFSWVLNHSLAHTINTSAGTVEYGYIPALYFWFSSDDGRLTASWAEQERALTEWAEKDKRSVVSHISKSSEEPRFPAFSHDQFALALYDQRKETYWHYRENPGSYERDLQAAYDSAPKHYQDLRNELAALEAFCMSFRAMLKGLVAEPIMVESGHYVPKYSLEESISNAQARVAKTFATLSAFTAHCKLVGGEEHTMRTFDLPTGINGERLMLRMCQIEERTARTYGRKREEIEEEVQRRQESWRRPPEEKGTKRKVSAS